jgi:hypothetical protein
LPCFVIDWHNAPHPVAFHVETEASKQKYHTYQLSSTSMGYWAVAQSPILITMVALERMRKKGYKISD